MKKHDGREQRQSLLPACDFRTDRYGALLTEEIPTEPKKCLSPGRRRKILKKSGRSKVQKGDIPGGVGVSWRGRS